MRAKNIGTLRKWKRDALELMWKCEVKDAPSYAEVKLTTKRLTELIDDLLLESSILREARDAQKGS